jgi:hypothetical protein
VESDVPPNEGSANTQIRLFPIVEHRVRIAFALLLGLKCFLVTWSALAGESPCQGIVEPGALAQKILEIRHREGWNNTTTPECYSFVESIFDKAEKPSTPLSENEFVKLEILAGAINPDDLESVITQTFALIINKDRRRLQQIFSKNLPRVEGYCTRLELKNEIKEALCNLDHPAKGHLVQDSPQSPLCTNIRQTFWRTYSHDDCLKEHGS